MTTSSPSRGLAQNGSPRTGLGAAAVPAPSPEPRGSGSTWCSVGDAVDPGALMGWASSPGGPSGRSCHPPILDRVAVPVDAEAGRARRERVPVDDLKLAPG